MTRTTLIVSRFMSNVDTSGDCWTWTGARNGSGYGRAYDPKRKQTRYAHKLAFEYFHEWSPKEILHSCDTPSCVRPTHLKGGTHAENMRDMAVKARGNTAKLSADDVRSIRKEFVPGRGGNSSELQKTYGISRHTVRQIAVGETWKDVK